MTDNEKPANGPLPGDHSLVEAEHRGAASVASPGYYPSLAGDEISGADRSGCFPSASFTGSHTGPNRVFAWRSEDEYQGVTFLCTREPGELFLCGGNLPEAKSPLLPGPYVARVDPATGRQIWHTYVENANVTGNWIGRQQPQHPANGMIVTALSNQIALHRWASPELTEATFMRRAWHGERRCGWRVLVQSLRSRACPTGR